MTKRAAHPGAGRCLMLIWCLPASIALALDEDSGALDGSDQVSAWSKDDMRFFLHGSMSTEVFPEHVLQAFRATYPDLVPGKDLTVFGLIADAQSDLPIGVSRGPVAHLGGMSCLGINCASCHVAQVERGVKGGRAVRVLGVTSHFDPEALFGAAIAATFQTADPANMERFLKNYMEACDPQVSDALEQTLSMELGRQGAAIAQAMSAYQAKERALPPGDLIELDPGPLQLTGRGFEAHRELAPVAVSMLKLFHNMRAALHIPQQPPSQAPPRSGPGRNNAFGVLSVALFKVPTLYAPAKFGVAWNLTGRTWVHWDGNTRSPILRNLAASLGLGAPLVGNRGMVNYSLVERHTKLTERIRPPRYPWKINRSLADAGGAVFEARCASCHVHARDQEDARLHALDEVRTDPNRARLFNDRQVELYDRFFAELEIPGYDPPRKPVRVTHKYVAVDLAGVWARSPYLHNGSVRTMSELLTGPDQRAKSFLRGSRLYDEANMGYTDQGSFVFDTTTDGNSKAGHEYGVDLTPDQKRALIEYLKRL